MNTVTEMSNAFDVTHEDLFADVKKRFPGEYLHSYTATCSHP